MSLFDKLGRPASSGPASKSPQSGAQPQLRQIKAYDKYGREVMIPEAEWREKILPGRLQQVWNDPQGLYQTVAVAVQDRFHADVLEASRHLLSLAPDNEQIACLHGNVLLRNELASEAEAYYWDFLANHPQSASVKANLAKAVAARGDAAGAEALLWQALEIDPNQSDGLLWWGGIYKERAGDKGFLDAMQKVTQLPGSWRAELWLARHALESKDLESALGYYRVVQERAPDDPDALMMISGDLGNNGYVEQIVNVLGPIYNPERHGPFAGLNLLQAYLATRDLAGARRLLHELFELNRPDIQAHLARFSEECDRLKDEIEPLRQDETAPSIEWAVLTTPVWYPDLEDPVWLLPKKREPERILFVTLANTSRTNIQEVTKQKNDDLGRLTRSIPLHLAEAFLFETSFSTATALPLVNAHYPVVSGVDWSKEHVVQLARSADRKMDYVVTGSISEEAGEYTVTFRVWNVAAEAETATFSQTGGKSKIERITSVLQGDLLQFFHQPTAVQTTPISSSYRAPGPDQLGEYLLAIEQSLVLLLARRAGSGNELWGERSLLTVPLNLSLRIAGAPIPKLMFLAGLIRNKAYGSEIYQEFKPQVLALLEDAQADGPLARLTPLIYRLYDDPEEFLLSKDRIRKTSAGEYAAWLDRLQFSSPTGS